MFETAQGRARWRICYDLVSELQPGDVLTYSEVEDACSSSRQAAQAAMIQANVRLGRDGQNTVKTRTNIGWLVLPPGQAVPLIEQQRRKAARADDRHAERVNASQLRRGELTQEERAVVDHEQRIALAKVEINGRRRLASRTLADRIAELERGAPKRLRDA